MKPAASRNHIASVDKALSLLNHFTLHRTVLNLNELCALSGFSRPTVYRLITTLEDHGFLNRVEGGNNEYRYRLGFRFLEIGNLVREQLEVRRVALPHMVKLRDSVGDSVQLVVADGCEGVYVEVVEAIKPIRLYISPGRRAPLYAGASTRLLLSFMPAERIARILKERPPVSHTPSTMVDIPGLLKVLDGVRGLKYAISRAELEHGSAELAAPLYDHAGEVIAALSIAGPLDSYREENLPGLLPVLQRTAMEISRQMGFFSTDNRA